ncbi:hypothetical protein PR048_013431 [Dryococelus australis]|uniref:Uncharacterized protein n=1 Tax=Dryococelus australis TaxID=614101 RepID=A0ABQ9HSB6_9NEOP|nr:hypothetical protein PR048_013431 [Dryococelus australis]
MENLLQVQKEQRKSDKSRMLQCSSGSLKLRPLLTGKSKSPGAFKNLNVNEKGMDGFTDIQRLFFFLSNLFLQLRRSFKKKSSYKGNYTVGQRLLSSRCHCTFKL